MKYVENLVDSALYNLVDSTPYGKSLEKLQVKYNDEVWAQLIWGLTFHNVVYAQYFVVVYDLKGRGDRPHCLSNALGKDSLV